MISLFSTPLVHPTSLLIAVNPTTVPKIIIIFIYSNSVAAMFLKLLVLTKGTDAISKVYGTRCFIDQKVIAPNKAAYTIIFNFSLILSGM